MIEEKLAGLTNLHTLQLQRPGGSADGKREAYLGTLKDFFVGASLVSGPGDPNELGVAGSRGKLFEDTAGGALYVYGETLGAGFEWLPIMAIGGSAEPSGGVPGAIVRVVGSGVSNYWEPGSELFDATGAYIADWSDGTFDLYDGTNVRCLSARSRSLFDENGLTAMDWAGRGVYDANSTPSMDWEIRVLFGFDGNVRANWEGTSMFDAISGAASLDWTSRALYDNGEAVAASWNDRGLYNASASLSLTWSDPAVGLFISVPDFPQLINNSASDTSAAISSVGVQNFTPVNGGTTTVLSSAASDLEVTLDNPGIVGTHTISIKSWADQSPNGARITITALSAAITALTVTAPGYTFRGTAATTLPAGGSIQYRRAGVALVRIQNP